MPYLIKSQSPTLAVSVEGFPDREAIRERQSLQFGFIEEMHIAQPGTTAAPVEKIVSRIDRGGIDSTGFPRLDAEAQARAIEELPLGVDELCARLQQSPHLLDYLIPQSFPGEVMKDSERPGDVEWSFRCSFYPGRIRQVSLAEEARKQRGLAGLRSLAGYGNHPGTGIETGVGTALSTLSQDGI